MDMLSRDFGHGTWFFGRNGKAFLSELMPGYEVFYDDPKSMTDPGDYMTVRGKVHQNSEYLNRIKVRELSRIF